MTPAAGEIWLADLGAETRRPVYVVSDERFQRFAERVIVAPMIPNAGAGPMPPWWIVHADVVIALDRLTTIAVERLLDRRQVADASTLRTVQRALGAVIGPTA